MDKRKKAKELFNNSGIINNAYTWHIWKRAFDLGVAYANTSNESERVCEYCDKKEQEGKGLYLCAKCLVNSTSQT